MDVDEIVRQKQQENVDLAAAHEKYATEFYKKRQKEERKARDLQEDGVDFSEVNRQSNEKRALESELAANEAAVARGEEDKVIGVVDAVAAETTPVDPIQATANAEHGLMSHDPQYDDVSKPPVIALDFRTESAEFNTLRERDRAKVEDAKGLQKEFQATQFQGEPESHLDFTPKSDTDEEAQTPEETELPQDKNLVEERNIETGVTRPDGTPSSQPTPEEAKEVKEEVKKKRTTHN